MKTPVIDWLEEDLMNPNHNEVFVGYTSYIRNKVASINNGIFIGYRQGRPFFWMKFRESVEKGRMKQDIWSHHKSLITLFDIVHHEITGPPLILLSSKKAIKWLEDSAYKYVKLTDKDKSKLWFWTDVLHPVFKPYDAMSAPYSILRELCLAENVNVSMKASNKQFFDYAEFDKD
jgi:hypothetical protein